MADETFLNQFESGEINAAELVKAIEEKVSPKLAEEHSGGERDPEVDELIKKATIIQRQISRARRRGVSS